MYEKVLKMAVFFACEGCLKKSLCSFPRKGIIPKLRERDSHSSIL